MIDLTWRLFSQTGNIETYLLLKELEERARGKGNSVQQEDEEVSSIDTKL
ncbi:YqzL-like protein [Virgibacillus subterraneus]|uniref:YqzL-like protein n=2 Tax=Virgibacillus TaxID=84406 RepID=A0A1H1BB23_9BACI|nr:MULTISPECIES: YqzL family protein [Virgibacillus]SDQ49083.1 YqzL-like protein [Virgibacillus salinus]SEQ17971.1 YqzL-like protein [Virgibacillus subterraneus]